MGNTKKGPLHDPRAEAVIDRMLAEASRQRRGVVARYLPQLPRVLLGKGVRWDDTEAAYFDDKYIPIDRDQGALLYMLTRSVGARNVVEFGTSFGVSTIYLACAVRDNGGGIVVGTEFVPAKAEQARANIEEAGLTEYVDIREGDARETLRSLEWPIDLVLIDGFPNAALEVLRVIEPAIRPGGIVITDDVGTFRDDLRPYRRFLQDSANGYRTTTLGLNGGTEFAIREV